MSVCRTSGFRCAEEPEDSPNFSLVLECAELRHPRDLKVQRCSLSQSEANRGKILNQSSVLAKNLLFVEVVRSLRCLLPR